jgi:hypothetical protein
VEASVRLQEITFPYLVNHATLVKNTHKHLRPFTCQGEDVQEEGGDKCEGSREKKSGILRKIFSFSI